MTGRGAECDGARVHRQAAPPPPLWRNELPRPRRLLQPHNHELPIPCEGPWSCPSIGSAVGRCSRARWSALRQQVVAVSPFVVIVLFRWMSKPAPDHLLSREYLGALYAFVMSSTPIFESPTTKMTMTRVIGIWHFLPLHSTVTTGSQPPYGFCAKDEWPRSDSERAARSAWSIGPAPPRTATSCLALLLPPRVDERLHKTNAAMGQQDKRCRWCCRGDC
jgi:hypothetical protein